MEGTVLTPRLARGLSRRTVLAGALATTACAGGRGAAVPPVARKPLADAHAHFFNLADLPVAGFVTYSIVGNIFPPPAWGEALIDFVTGFAKRFARTARQEAEGLGRDDYLDAATFGRRAADYVDQRLATAPASSAGGRTLGTSYGALLRELAAQTGVPTPDYAIAVPAAAIDTKRAAFTRAARFEEQGETTEAAAGFNPIAAVGEVARTIGWAYLMIQSRRAHIDRYLARQRSDDREPRTVVSLLVDYDYWLDDTPATGSDQIEQIRTMTRLHVDVRDRADIRLFAGVCPLRLAIQRRTGRPALFDQLKAAAAAGQVQGFKLYPPMGFWPTGNGRHDNRDYNPPPARRKTAWDRWRQETGAEGERTLGRALDEALDEVYAHAAAHRVPIVAHSGSGNGAARGYGARANPIHWEPVVARHHIRLSLGHLVNEAKPFVNAVLRGGPRDGVWALDAPVRMLDRRRPDAPDVYADLAYMPELNDEAMCKAFFRALAKTFAPGDPKPERILYGTDWIMYAREARSDSYLRNVEKGMRAAEYGGEQIDNILWNNARRFLGLA